MTPALALLTDGEASLPDYHHGAPRLRPRLRNQAWLDRRQIAARRRRQEVDGGYRRLAPDLFVSLVIDDEETMTTVGDRLLRRWGVSFEHAFRRAVANLAERSTEPYLSVGPGLWLAPWEDGYASSRLMCTLPPGEDLVAALPDHDVLLFADPHRPESLEALAYALDDLDCDSPLSEQLLRIRQLDDGTVMSPYQMPEDHPAAAVFRDRLFGARLRDYETQRASLERAWGGQFHVAGVRSLRDDEGQLCSYALWSAGVNTLLPEVDRVHLLESDVRGGRLWSADLMALRALPGALLRHDGSLPRWRTARFPSPGELRAVATPLELDPRLAWASAS